MEKTVFFLDYDDTLLNTSEICSNINFNTNDLNYDMDLSLKCVKFLRHLLKFGKVFIVSNASHFWFQQTCGKILPDVYNLIHDSIIEFISAREKYSIYDDNQFNWKFHSFVDIIMSDKYSNVISIGDSIHEKKACDTLDTIYPLKTLSIQFVENPKKKELLCQMEYILENFSEILKINKKSLVVER